jgi:hypothetical protein
LLDIRLRMYSLFDIFRIIYTLTGLYPVSGTIGNIANNSKLYSYEKINYIANDGTRSICLS